LVALSNEQAACWQSAPRLDTQLQKFLRDFSNQRRWLASPRAQLTNPPGCAMPPTGWTSPFMMSPGL
jgi:hypothetical protein